jgi:hypothetical protein
MSQNLNLLRQDYCRPAVVDGKRDPFLFALEKECEQGKALIAKTPKTSVHLEKFNPHGLLQTYRDEATGAELPLFAVFDLEGRHQVSCEITTDSVSATAEPRSLPAYIPFQKTLDFVRKINEGRMKAEHIAIRMSAILGFLSVLTFLFSNITVLTGPSVVFIVLGGWVLGAFLAYVLSQLLLNRICPWKKLVVTAEFDGILPKEVREKARAAKDCFDHLYLIVDQQNRWKSALLRDPTPRTLDPLLIGELKQGRRRQFFLIDQFDLTEAEQYLADEFATKQDETLFSLPRTEI